MLSFVFSCGARTKGIDPPVPDGAVASPLTAADGAALCRTVRDCQGLDLCDLFECVDGVCQALDAPDCDDQDACTEDTCDPKTGECTHVPLTFDDDGDGYRAPLAGYLPGEAGGCGQDCDDTSDRAHPGGTEICDGVDNNCDGVIDEAFAWAQPTRDPVLVSEAGEQASLGGLVYNDEFYAISYSGWADHQQNRVVGLDARGRVVLPSTDVALVNNDTYAGPIVWTGRAFGVAWEDRRDDDFEIYFNRMDTEGNKLGADLRVTNALGFSLNPSMRYTGQEYIVFWQDRRDPTTDFGIWAQRISRNGELIGDNQALTPDLFEAEGPSCALGRRNMGFTFNTPVEPSVPGSQRQIVFRTVSFDLSTVSDPLVLSEPGGAGSSVSYNNGSYIVAWETYDHGPGDSIWAAVVTEDGELIVPAQQVTEPVEYARSHSLLPLGDRLVLIWAEYEDGSYDLYRRLLAPDLTPLTDKQQITSSDGDSLWAGATLGDQGELGVAYMDLSTGIPSVYFMTLECTDAAP